MAAAEYYMRAPNEEENLNIQAQNIAQGTLLFQAQLRGFLFRNRLRGHIWRSDSIMFMTFFMRSFMGKKIPILIGPLITIPKRISPICQKISYILLFHVKGKSPEKPKARRCERTARKHVKAYLNTVSLATPIFKERDY